MMARRVAAMRLMMRGVGAGGWRAGDSGILSIFHEKGISHRWSGGLPGPMAVVIRNTILILDSGCKRRWRQVVGQFEVWANEVSHNPVFGGAENQKIAPTKSDHDNTRITPTLAGG